MSETICTRYGYGFATHAFATSCSPHDEIDRRRSVADYTRFEYDNNRKTRVGMMAADARRMQKRPPQIASWCRGTGNGSVTSATDRYSKFNTRIPVFSLPSFLPSYQAFCNFFFILNNFCFTNSFRSRMRRVSLEQ